MSRTNASSSSASPPLQHDAQPPSQGRYPTRAYGILLDGECIHRFGVQLYERVRPGQLAEMSPEEARKKVLNIRGATLSSIAHMVYNAFPNIPELRHNLILMNDVAGIWLLVLKDISSHSCANAYLDPEDVKGAKRMLGLQSQVARWHHVDGWD